MKTTQNSSLSPNALRYAVHRQAISWLIRHNGFIVYKERNTYTSQSHTCQVPELLFREQIQLIIGIIVRSLQDGFPKNRSIDSFQHFFIPSETEYSSRLVLSVRCDPVISLVQTPKVHNCIDFTLQTSNQLRSTPINAIITSWFIRTGVHVVCHQVPQQMVLDYYVNDCTMEESTNEVAYPLSLRPYLSLLEYKFKEHKETTAHPERLSISTSNPSIPPNDDDDDHGTKNDSGTKHENGTKHDAVMKDNQDDDNHGIERNDNFYGQKDDASPKKKKQQKQSPQKSPTCTHSYSTRFRNATIAKILQAASRSKHEINYPDHRHQPGKPAKTTTPVRCTVRIPEVDYVTIQQRLEDLAQMKAFHEELKSLGKFVPRDKWTTWLDCCHDPTADRPFMMLMTICMSSSTSDKQLSSIMPRLFACGLTSAQAVIEIALQFGMNALCCLLSECGRYYPNTERIVNAADYFCQRHDGKIPHNITIYELTTLHGIGYKTACIIIEAAFDRVDGIPADIHVIRWSEHLSWIPLRATGMPCSKILESWIPKESWNVINPMFGAFGQHSSTYESRSEILSQIGNTNLFDNALRQKMRSMIHKYHVTS